MFHMKPQQENRGKWDDITIKSQMVENNAKTSQTYEIK